MLVESLGRATSVVVPRIKSKWGSGGSFPTLHPIPRLPHLPHVTLHSVGVPGLAGLWLEAPTPWRVNESMLACRGSEGHLGGGARTDTTLQPGERDEALVAAVSMKQWPRRVGGSWEW